MLANISPIPSQMLATMYRTFPLIITLDSGATVSFIKLYVVRVLGIPVLPNNQLATLADEKTRMASLGEIDQIVKVGKIFLRFRALVMKHLQADCFGGTTFHVDNNIEPDMVRGEIKIHGKYIVKQANLLPRLPACPPPVIHEDDDDDHHAQPSICAMTQTDIVLEISTQTENQPDLHDNVDQETSDAGEVITHSSSTMNLHSPPSQPTKSPTISMKAATVLLPRENCMLPIPGLTTDPGKLAVIPNFSEMDGDLWRPQVCDVVEGCALYVNKSEEVPISHPKNAHFQTLSVKEYSLREAKSVEESNNILAPVKMKPLGSDDNEEDLTGQIKINKEVLRKEQIEKLEVIHGENVKVFNGELNEGYNHKAGKYLVRLGFKKENKPPPAKVWAPQYNRTCSDLLQAKCDQLERQGVLTDPKKHNIDIRHVSPIFIQQKGRARHKKLPDCSLEELRFITCFNVLNEDLHPIPSKSVSHINIFKFLARWKFHIHGDLTNSYFQIPMDKRFWGYLAVMTPHRGLRVMTRTGQGLLNSELHLDELIASILGDEISEGICMSARDDLSVGGNTIDELINNWRRVLTKLNNNNLKISPNKTRILLDDTEVYGHRIQNGKVLPSNHIISNLGKIKIEEITTVKKLNSWKGLYKTLISHLPNLSKYMSPFDKATGGKESKDKFNWTPELTAAFNEAAKHLDKINATVLPDPNDRLFLLPDTATHFPCTGWSLHARKEMPEGTKLLPVQYASAKLPAYMTDWYACEAEGVGAVLAIDQCASWINESYHTTMVGPDSMPVVKAANLMKTGRHSKNPRLQSLLSSVNRRNVRFFHNSAKAGLHLLPDHLSRLNRSCGAKDCAMERFLEDIPSQIQSMAMEVVLDNLTDMIFSDMTPCTIAATTAELSELLLQSGPIPLGSRNTWKEIQSSDFDCRQVFRMKGDGSMPRKKHTSATLNKLYRESVVEDGLLVKRSWDKNLMREVSRTCVPPQFLHSILTVMHMRTLHPSAFQLQQVFEKHFFSIAVKQKCEDINEGCSICIGLKKFPKELGKFDPKLLPDHPGSHMNADVMKRAGQIVLVNCDLFSGYTTACLCRSERSEDMTEAILQVVTPIRHAHSVIVRTDKAPALKSLAEKTTGQLAENGIKLILGDDINKNSNCCVDKKIQELELELKKIVQAGSQLRTGDLSKAVTVLNSRIRNQGLSSAEIHFSRDSDRGENLKLDDADLNDEKLRLRLKNNVYSERSKAPKGKSPGTLEAKPGDIVFVKNQLTKHQARDPFIVVGDEGGKKIIRKILHSSGTNPKAPKISHEELTVDDKFLFHQKKIENESKIAEELEKTDEIFTTDKRSANPEIMKPQQWNPIRSRLSASDLTSSEDDDEDGADLHNDQLEVETVDERIEDVDEDNAADDDNVQPVQARPTGARPKINETWVVTRKIEREKRGRER